MKKRTVSCGLALVLTICVCAADAPPDYTSKSGKFSARFPGKPKEQSLSAGGASGQAIVLEAKDASYSVTYVDLPASAADALKTPELADTILQATRDAAVAQMKGKLLDDEKVKLDGHVGRAIKVELPDKKVMRNRIYLVGPRIYQVMVLGTKEFVASDDSEKFLKSFKLMK